jgi:hypothetical protein
MSVVYKKLEFLGFPKYRVGTDGSVWYLKEWKGHKKVRYWRKVKPIKWKSTGYLYITLCSAPIRKRFLLHRLVLEAFVGPCPEGMQARHFPDRDRTNCCLDNLSWGSSSDNNGRDKEIHGTIARGEKIATSKLTSDDVREIRKAYLPRRNGGLLCEKYGIDRSQLWNIVTRRQWKHVI